MSSSSRKRKNSVSASASRNPPSEHILTSFNQRYTRLLVQATQFQIESAKNEMKACEALQEACSLRIDGLQMLLQECEREASVAEVSQPDSEPSATVSEASESRRTSSELPIGSFASPSGTRDPLNLHEEETALTNVVNEDNEVPILTSPLSTSTPAKKNTAVHSVGTPVTPYTPSSGSLWKAPVHCSDKEKSSPPTSGYWHSSLDYAHAQDPYGYDVIRDAVREEK